MVEDHESTKVYPIITLSGFMWSAEWCV